MSEEVPAANGRTHPSKGETETDSRNVRRGRTWLWLTLGSVSAVCGVLLWTSLRPAPEFVAARTSSTPLPSSASTPSPVDTPAPATEPSPTASKVEMAVRAALLPGKLGDLSAAHQATAAHLLEFSKDGDLSALESVTAADVESLAAALIAALGMDEVGELLEEGLKLPAGYLQGHPQPARAVADLYEAVKGTGEPTTVRTLVFTDRCEEDGAVTGNVHVIPSGVRRVYAAFENAGGLHGLDRVFAVWRNPADTRMVFAEYEPVHAGTAFNYVWLDLSEGWPAGHYELALYHPQRTTELLAARSFNVR